MDSSQEHSNVCSGLCVDFYWIDNPAEDESEHISQAVDALFQAISIPGVRRWSPYNAPLVKAQFKNRIQKAARGDLEPPDELKPVSNGRLPLYEIRWSGISVHERSEDGGPDNYFDVEARLLHGEPDELGVCFIGLHAHEKQYRGTPAEIKQAQNAQIETAANLYLAARPRQWGVTRRTRG